MRISQIGKRTAVAFRCVYAALDRPEIALIPLTEYESVRSCSSFGRSIQHPGNSMRTASSKHCRLNVFTAGLADICRTEVLREKWLIVPSLRAGHQWLDIIAHEGIPVLNCRIKTLKGTALELAGPEMARQGLSLVSSTASLMFIDVILQRLPSHAYLAGLPVGQGLCKAVLAAVNSMRSAGMTPHDLDSSHFEEPSKATDIAFIFSEYLEMLQKNNLVDYRTVLEFAVSALRTLPSSLDNILILIPANHDPGVPKNRDFSAMERTLIGSIPTDRVKYIPVDGLFDVKAAQRGRYTDLSLLGMLSRPADAPAPTEDGTVKIFHAVGEANEVREVLRRCIAERYHFDQVELLHTDAKTYVPLIYEIFSTLEVGADTENALFPVTFAEGIPTTYSRPGRALMGWMQWMRQRFPQTICRRMIEAGLLSIKGMGKSGIGFDKLADIFRKIPIGWGRENYESRINALLDTLSEEHADAGVEESTNIPDDLMAQRLLGNMVKKLLAVTPPENALQPELLQAAIRFLDEVVESRNEMDNYSREALRKQIEEMARCIDLVGGNVCLDVAAWLEALPAETRVLGSGPRPGLVHVANISSGGMTGRKHTFIIGLDDGRFPAGGLNDPLLLDSERTRLSSELTTSAQLLSRKMEHFAMLTAGLRGTLTLGFSSLNLADDREAYPSPVVFSAFRILSKNRDVEQTDLMQWLGLPASFAPTTAAHCLNETEWWLWSLCSGKKVRDPHKLVESRFAGRHRARIAQEHRLKADFTEYDGWIPNLPEELDPTHPSGPPMSAAGLETIGQCPLRYFFQYVLRIKPPQEATPDVTQWLDALEFGELLHEVFYQFMSELIDQRRKPLFKRDFGRLVKILEDRVEHYKKIRPPYSWSAFRQQEMLLAQAVRIFLMEEEELCRTHRPMFLEVSLGMKSMRQQPGPLDTSSPLPLSLLGGRSIRVRGRLDRVDQISDDVNAPFAICDYKTGSDSRYADKDPFRQGRIIQHALYLLMSSIVLKQKVSQTAEPAHFEFFFTGAKGRGRRIRLAAPFAARAREIIDNLCSIVAHGCFLGTTNADHDCRFCNYSSICGDVKFAAERAAFKLDNSSNPGLEPLRKLRKSERK